ncbi:hypothetical protein, partial [Palleronia aestuarii]|uniref:hypothetical protein n=1 Tax=Palleronia aestuarii TaxID=568105 RepID=UPI001B878735
ATRRLSLPLFVRSLEPVAFAGSLLEPLQLPDLARHCSRTNGAQWLAAHPGVDLFPAVERGFRHPVRAMRELRQISPTVVPASACLNAKRSARR